MILIDQKHIIKNLGEKRFLKLCWVFIFQNVRGKSNIIVCQRNSNKFILRQKKEAICQ